MTELFSRQTRRGEFLCCGPDSGPLVLLLQPLFEEANRFRRTLALCMRALGDLGIASILPDLPGTGESLTPIDAVRMADWQDHVRALCDEARPTGIASFRGGSLLDDMGLPCWRFAPETGARLIRDLERVRAASRSGDTGAYAGHRLSAAFVEELRAMALHPAPRLRTVRLEGDAQPADLVLPGAPLWRRAEPGEDPELALAMARDIADWVAQCGAR